MKTIAGYVLAFLLTISVSCDSSSDIRDQSLVGRYVFSLLQKINVKSFSEYKQSFISFNELKVILNDTILVPSADKRIEMSLVTERELEEERKLEKNFNRLRADGIELGIDWSKIVYIDYIYEKENDMEIVYSGKTYFRYGEEVYYVKSNSIYDGSVHKLFDICCMIYPQDEQ
jgi:hypothetical protein